MNSLLKQATFSRSIPRFSRMSVTAAIALMLLSLLSLTSVHTAHAAASDDNLSAKLLALINQNRAAQNLPAYVENSALSQGASNHSSKMAQAGQFNVSGEPGAGERISNEGIQATSWGENVGYAYPQPDAWGGVQAVHNNMMTQDGQRQNLLSSSSNQIGIGIAVDSKGVVWVTEDFVQAQMPAPGATNPAPTPGTTDTTSTPSATNTTPGTTNPAPTPGATDTTPSATNPAPTPGATDTTSPPAATNPAPANTDTLRQQLLALINQDRAAQNLPAYTENTALSQAANTHSSKMAQLHQLAHTLPGEADPAQRISSADPQMTSWGENVGFSSPQPDAWGGVQVVHKNMMAEVPPNDGHRRNLLSTTFTQIGIGIVIDDKGVVWVTEDFVK